MKRASFVIAVSTLLGTTFADNAATAQDPVRLRSRLIPRGSMAGAFDARNNGRGDPEMYLALAALEWSTSVTGLAVRVDGIYAGRDRINRVEPPCLDCDRVGNSYSFLSSKVTAAGAMLGTTYELRNRGALRPYVLASGGLVLTHDRFTSGTITRSRCDVGPCTVVLGAAVTQRNDRPVSAAAHVGAGLVYSWRWVSVLAEARSMTVDHANTRGLNGAVPVSLGVRF